MDKGGSWISAALPDVLALLGTITLVAGGAALIASSIPWRAEILARRSALALPRPALKPVQASAQIPLASIARLPPAGGGLTEAEQRQVVRIFTGLGIPPARAYANFVMARLALSGALGAILLLAVWHFTGGTSSWWLPFLAMAMGGIGGWLLPILFIDHLVRQRTKAVAHGLPDALELLVVCVEAGLSLEDGLQRVARELKESQPALADELILTWAELNILPSRAQALANLADRMGVPGVRSVVSTLSQSLRFGTPLAQSLRVAATEIRNEQMMLLEERASRLPALLTIPVMLFIMPTIFLIIGGPAALRLIDSFAGGAH
ncbi:MAG TPA: type II secretion system F family protein [Methylocella sp.]|nr:type II secretion system F family protein [Methylocella sp.]